MSGLDRVVRPGAVGDLCDGLIRVGVSHGERIRCICGRHSIAIDVLLAESVVRHGS